jgi:hypothetical protein
MALIVWSEDARLNTAITAITISLLISLLAYRRLSKHEGTYINILTPSFLIAIPAYYLLPLLYLYLAGTNASSYAYWYVFATLAAENVAFVYAYVRTGKKVIKLPFRSSNRNFAVLSVTFLCLGTLTYLPLLLKFREYLLDPRQIYVQTRTGFGTEFFISSTLAFIAIIFILFSERSWVTKSIVTLGAFLLLSLHGSKAQALAVPLLLLLFWVYAKGLRIRPAFAAASLLLIAVFAVLLFAATMSLEGSLGDALEEISSYSDYTRNAMLVIDSNLPLQYGRLTFEANTTAIVPRALSPHKPKNFGPFYLAEQFYPQSFDADQGAPAFGVGIQYADFGYLAIVYVILTSILKGWLARCFVNRLAFTKHPADFFMVAFLADIPLFPLGVGWLLPEAIAVTLVLRFLSTLGAKKTYLEHLGPKYFSATPKIDPLRAPGKP